MSKFHKQSESMKALEQSLNDHMEICSLKRQVKRLKAQVAKLKAEVERLDTLCKQVMAQHSDISCENIILRKAGDAMASSIQFNEEMSQDYNGPTIVHQSVQRWNAAKEGKQP
jgi:archaellum component FlaC